MTFDLSTANLFVIGNPIHHSLSPKMHQKMLDGLKIPYHYGALLIPTPSDLTLFFEAMRYAKIRGINVTVPYKEAVIPFLDELDDRASRCGAVNTIVNQNGRLVGYNTDGIGFIRSLKEDLDVDVSGKKVVVLGAGGAAKGLVDALCASSIKSCTILNRTRSKADVLRYDMESCYKLPFHVGTTSFLEGDSDWTALSEADLVIQSTSVGMGDLESKSPVPMYSWVRKGQVCIDIIYKPIETRFLQQVKAAGAKIANGAGMLAGQGAVAFDLFTGQQSNYQLMKEVVING